MFFFPEYKYSQIRNLSPYHYMMIPSVIYGEPRKVFNYQCRRFLGLGFLMSFIPGTTAFMARKNLNNILSADLGVFWMLQHNIGFFKSLSYSVAFQGPILNFLLLGPLWSAMSAAVSKFDSGILKNYKLPFSTILKQLPILRDITHLYSGENLLHSLLNPARFIGHALSFGHMLLNRIFEIGSTKDSPSHFLVAALKFITAIPFAVVSVPVVLVREILDIPYQILKSFVYQPLKFIALSFAQPFRNTDDLQKRSDALFNQIDENKNNPALYNKKQLIIPTTHRDLNKVLGSNSTTLIIEPTDDNDNDDSSQNTGTPRSRTASLPGSPSNKFFDNNLNVPTDKDAADQGNNPLQEPTMTPIPGQA